MKKGNCVGKCITEKTPKNEMLLFYLRLCTRDPHQLFLRLESQVREFVIEMKVKLLKQLNSGYKSPPEAKSFIQLLLDEYEHLCVVSRKMGKILEKLVSILVGYFREEHAHLTQCKL